MTRLHIVEKLLWISIGEAGTQTGLQDPAENIVCLNHRPERGVRIRTKVLADKKRSVDSCEQRRLTGAALGQSLYTQRRIKRQCRRLSCLNRSMVQRGQCPSEQNLQDGNAGREEGVCGCIFFANTHTIKKEEENVHEGIRLNELSWMDSLLLSSQGHHLRWSLPSLHQILRCAPSPVQAVPANDSQNVRTEAQRLQVGKPG